MSYLRFVCLLASTLTAAAMLMAVAQAPVLQQGISVQMAATSNAVPMPQADEQGAWIIAVTADGKVYSGVDPITLPDLAEKVKTTPFERGQNLYIKADARTKYGRVLQVLETSRTGGIAPQVLLTAQSTPSAPGMMVPPKGLEVILDAPSGAEPTLVQLVDSGQTEPELRVNGQTVSYAALPGALTQSLQNTSERVVLVRANGRLPFAEVVRLIDACRATGAKVVLDSSEI